MKSDKNFKKRLLSGILSTVLLANFSTVLPITVFADDETTQETVNATVVNGHRYQLYDMAMNWNDAAVYCEGLGGHLVTIASGEEQLIVEGLLSNGTKNNYWLGGSVNADGNWAWVTGEAFVYENWANEQPDNYLGSENALMMYRNVNPANESGSGFGLWNDLLNDGTCNNETFFGVENFGFICEWESVDTPVEEEKSMKNYALFSASQTTNLSFYGWKSNISGNVYSGASFVYGGSELYIDGRVDTVGSLTANGWKTEISEINENITPLNTLDLDEDIHKNAQPYEYFEESPAYVEDKTVISSSIKVAGDVVISGTTFEGDCYIIADGNITYNVESFSSTGRVFLYSRNGNITINGSQININGAMYAPNGNVAFNTYDTTVNGFIWADSISYSGSIFNVTGANFDMVEPKSIVKTYTIDEDFNEGTYNGLALTVPNQLVLSEQSGGTASSAVKVFGDTETGKGVKVTYSSDKSTVSSNGDTVNISYGLSGFGEADIDENAVDLIIVVDESGSMSGSRMRNTKAAAKEIIAQMKENDRCAVIGFTSYVSIKQSLTSDKDLLTAAVDKLYANGGTAIYQGINSALEMFDTMSSDERQKYIILLSDGEDGATAQSLAAAKTAGENGIRIFAMMIGSGTLQMQNIAINSNGIYKNAPTTEDIGKIMSYFAAEVFNVAGRNTAFKTTIKDKNAVDISALSPAPSKITENEDGSVTLEWNFDRITIDEEKTITIPLTVNVEESGFAELTENTSCVYYDRNGKPNVVYADDVAFPISNYAENGSWSVVFDSERADVNWKNIYWNGRRYGDGTISVQASVSADGVVFSNPVEIRNYENLSGLSGRYIKLEVSMTVSSDGRTPELYDITVASEDAVLSEFTNEEPTLEIVSKNVTKVNVPMHIRASLADDCLKSDINVAWSCESSNVKFEDSSKLMTTITCSETGSYDIICTISDGEKSVQAVRTVVCEPADSYADIDPDNEDEAVAPQISVILPQYADTNEVISAKIENLNNTEVSWYSVIFNTSTAVNVADDGSFTLTMPNRNGTYPVVVRAFDWAGKSDVKEYSIIVDSTSAAVEIIPSSDEAVIGTDAYFKVSTAGEHKIQYLEYALNGEAITLPEDGIVTVDTSAETEYILEAIGETITGKTLSASAKITVIEADTKKPEVQIGFNKSSYNEGNTAVVTITASDNVGITELEVLLNGEVVTLDSNNQFRITGLKYGEHVITANAYDEAGNKGTATKTLIAKDVTKPTLVLSVDKTEIKVGESINITVEAADNNGIVSTVLTVNNKELELTEDNTTVFTPDTAGTYTVKAVATDPSGNKQTKQVTVTVEELDTIAPVVTVSLDKDTYFELDDIIINVSATDNVGVTDTVLFIDGTEVELDENGSYTIKNAELKSYEIIAKAYDEETNEGTASETVVVNEAKAPEINVTFDKDMYIEGDSLEGLVTAQGQREIITLTAKVNGNPLTLEDGIFSIASLSAGEYTFVFTAEDAKEFTSVTEKKITVLKKENADRRLYAAIDGLVKYGETATLKVIASDEIDKSTISVQLNGEDIELTSELTYEFTGEKLFDNEFVVSAETTDGEKISITVNVTVYETDKPIITLTYDKEDGYYDHDDVIATVTAEDVSGIKRVQFLYDGVEYPIDENGVVIIKDFVVQHHSVIIRAWDNFGNCRTMVSVFVVREVEGSGDKSEIGSTDDETATLIAELYTPLDEQVITSPTFVVGTAGGTDFAKYRLDYASAAGGDYTLLKEGTSAIKENILGEFDPTMLRNGLYKVRLTVWDTNDNVKSAEVLVSVEGQMKIGNFSLDFQDLDVNLSGAPLTVIRGYDSRDRNISGDFGYGWNISTCGVTITKSCNLSTGWTEPQSGYNYIYSASQPHIISVNWGNGQTEKFVMKLKSGGMALCTQYPFPLKRWTEVILNSFQQDYQLLIGFMKADKYLSMTPNGTM